MYSHQPVLLKEVLDFLEPEANKTYIDGTLGLAGHSKAILESVDGEVGLVGFDRDPKSIKIANENLKDFEENIKIFNARFSEIPKLVEREELKFPLAGILLDLGISSFQLDNPDYGLSFGKKSNNKDLDMRLDQWCSISAKDILNKWPERKIADLFWDYADYKPARKLAKLVAQERPINTIGDFVNLCMKIPKGSSKIHSATLPLMALRIAVNDEYLEIEKALEDIINWMEPGEKLAVISFHSGEDRIVKNIFKKYKTKLEFFNMKPISPTQKEIKENPRSRSAKLRSVCKI